MNLLRTPHVPSRSTRLAGGALFASAALLLVGAGLALGSEHASPPPAATPSCEVPAGVDVASLAERDRGLVTRRLLACADREAGRISHDQYVAAIAKLDAEWTASPPPAPVVAMPSIVWASTVRGFSSQYTASSWAATQVLGEPDVFPGTGDNANAWASLGADDQPEWLEVGFDEPRRISAVEIYETYNPGATSNVELVTVSGKRITIQPERYLANKAGSARRIARVACTNEPIAYVRVNVDSVRVAGWNELDAIGVVPCNGQ
ncbi:MAG TPA: hypothetical protein VFQ53_08285 [Kofleriaceae bacterium]|nr:hypothetical protein [Kofleriaceae bacterium]